MDFFCLYEMKTRPLCHVNVDKTDNVPHFRLQTVILVKKKNTYVRWNDTEKSNVKTLRPTLPLQSI